VEKSLISIGRGGPLEWKAPAREGACDSVVGGACNMSPEKIGKRKKGKREKKERNIQEKM